MTILAPLPVEGLATPYVESIWSYVSRLAKVHGVRPKDIHDFVRNFCPDSSYKVFGGESGRTLGGWLAGYSSNACSYTKRLSILTGQQQCWALSLARLSGQLARNVTGCITPALRWCPLCISESKERIIEPLLWQIALVQTCPIHSVKLISCCTNCNRERAPRLNNAGSGVCGNCLMSLGSSESSPLKLSSFDDWRQNQILELLSYTSDPFEEDPAEDAIIKFFRSLYWSTLASSSESLDARAIALLQRFRKECLEKDHLPRLENLLDIAGCLGVSLRQIFTTPVEAASQPLNVGFSELHSIGSRQARSSSVWVAAIKAARDLVDKDGIAEMPTLASLCRSLGATSHGLHQRDPSLYLAYNEKLRLQQTNARKALFERSAELAAEYVDKCYREGIEAEVRSGALVIAGLTGGSKTLTEAAMRKALKRPQLKSDESFQGTSISG